jgi:hypothetical protein
MLAYPLITDIRVTFVGEMRRRRSEGITVWVRATAEARGVSERTVWRWAARAKAGGGYPMQGRRCEAPGCRHLLPWDASAARRFCDAACRMRAHRAATASRA